MKSFNLKYCPACCGELDLSDYKVFVCRSCGFHFYQNPKPTVLAIVRDEKDRVLFTRRVRDPKKGFLDLLGGFVDPGESAEEALCRELKEEAGVNISPEDLLYMGSFKSRYFYQVDLDILGLGFLVRPRFKMEDFVFDKTEISDPKFLSVYDVDVDQISFPDVRSIFKFYKNNLKYYSRLN